MLSSVILDVVIAIIFTFLAVSLVTGAVVEAIASFLKLRSTTLKQGVMDLLNDQTFDDLAAALYAHALVNPRGPGSFARPAPRIAAPALVVAPVGMKGFLSTVKSGVGVIRRDARGVLPAYIDPKLFAKALTDVLTLTNGKTAAELQAAVDAQVPAVAYPQINQLLTGIIGRAGANVSLVQQELSTWFDSSMDRVSGVYKRYTQAATFVLALLLSMAMNADPFLVGQRVWAQPTLIDQVKAEPQGANLTDEWAMAKSLPMGWSGHFGKVTDKNGTVTELRGAGGWGFAILGWLITAIASLFGAPFWFDTLQQVVRLKGSGPSPQEKADNTAAAG